MKFCTTYRYQGSDWALIIDADDWDDARARCKVLNCSLDGVLIARVPAEFGTIARATCAIRNFFTPNPR